VLWLYNFFFFLQVGQGEGAAPAATEGLKEGAQQAGEQATQTANPCGMTGGYDFILMMVFLFGLMYFLLIRPQKKQQRQHQELLGSLKKGDRVVTTGGLLGTIRGITTSVATVEVSDGVLVRVRKDHVAGLQTDPKADEGKK